MEKSKLFILMESNKKYTEAFTLLGSSETIDPEVIAIIEEHVCYFYCMKNERDIKDARTQLLKRLCGPGDLLWVSLSVQGRFLAIIL